MGQPLNYLFQNDLDKVSGRELPKYLGGWRDALTRGAHALS
jgi:hypothetical protein